ncbi:MAG: FAD-binding oxidoreductase [Lachnospiraceae bacterium]|nr:FAD-binding oxidoreductase [Lachnospiraceae bacterium]
MDVLDRLQKIVGEEHATDSPEVCKAYAYSTSITARYEHTPDYVVQPQNTQQVSEVLKLANELHIPVTPKGLVSGSGYAGPFYGGILLDLLDMDKVLHIDPVNMKAVAEAGCSFFKLSQEIFKQGMMLPTTQYTCGPGVAASYIGPAIAFGKTRYGRNCELVEGAEIVLPTGEICRIGSLAYEDSAFGPYTKYIHGPDLLGLYIMSNGAYGIVTKVAYACQKCPPVWQGASYYWKESDIKGCTDFMVEATNMEVYDIHMNDRWKYDLMTRGKNCEKVRPGLLDFLPEDAYFFMEATLNAFSQEEMDAKMKQMDELAEKYNGKKMGNELGGEFFSKWPTIHSVPHIYVNLLSSVYEMDKLNYQYIFDSIVYPTSKFDVVYPKMKELFEKYGFWGYPSASIIDCFPMKGQTICSQTWTYLNTRDEEMVDRVFAFRDEFREWFGKVGGTHQMHLPPITPDYAWKNQAEDYRILQKIKKALDPNNICSPATFEMEV